MIVSLPPPTQTPQAAGQRTFLRGRYAATKLYQAADNFVPTNQFEIGVSTGDLLGIIQQKDPMGDRSRWFCDNGVSQGFVPASLLAPLGTGDSSQLATDPQVARVDSPASVPHPIEVVEEKGSSKPVAVVAPYDEVAEEESKRPIRRAPGVPGLPRPRRKESDPGPGGGGASSNSRGEQGSVHSYEEIAASEIASETQSQDLSPIYEEIPGGSR